MTKKLSTILPILFMLILSVFVNANQTTSRVTFEFDGMMGIFTGDTQKVSVGFLNAHHHTPKIVIYKLIDNERREVARFSDEDLKRTLTVSVVGMNDLSTKPSLYQVLDGEQTDERDFRWTVDVERDLYKRKLKIKDNFFGKIHFQTGLFYSSKLSQEVLKFVSVDSSQTLPFFRQIGRPAAAVDLTIDQEVVITGLSQSVRLSAQNNTNYLVSVSNLPPEDMMNMDHFGFYYSVIDEELVRYLPVAVEKTFFGLTFKCIPAVFGESSID